MATQSLASNNSRRTSSEIRDPAKFLSLVDRMGLPHHLRRSLKGYYQRCSSPTGANPKGWVGLREVARDLEVSYRTFKRHHRKFRQLGLIEFSAKPNSDRRSKTWGFVYEQVQEQAWPDGLCQRCHHKHTDTECGCTLTPRRWPKKGWVERRCRCVPRPSENSGRSGPQRVESASPAPVERAATSTPVPPVAAPRQGNHRQVDQHLGSRAFERIKKQRHEFAARLTDHIRGRTSYVEEHSGLEIQLQPGNDGYRFKLPRDKAFLRTCQDMRMSEEEGRELMKGFGFDEAGSEEGP